MSEEQATSFQDRVERYQRAGRFGSKETAPRLKGRYDLDASCVPGPFIGAFALGNCRGHSFSLDSCTLQLTAGMPGQAKGSAQDFIGFALAGGVVIPDFASCSKNNQKEFAYQIGSAAADRDHLHVSNAVRAFAYRRLRSGARNGSRLCGSCTDAPNSIRAGRYRSARSLNATTPLWLLIWAFTKLLGPKQHIAGRLSRSGADRCAMYYFASDIDKAEQTHPPDGNA